MDHAGHSHPRAHALAGVFAGRLDTTDEARAHVARLSSWAGGQQLIRDGDGPEIELAGHLFPFQRTGVQFLLNAGSALLGDEMGTGKTIQAIEWMRRSQAKAPFGFKQSHLVVCPNSMKYKWAAEIEQWWPSVQVAVIDGTASQRRKIIEEHADCPELGVVVYVINYDALRLHSRLKPWGGKTVTDAQKAAKDLNGIEFASMVLDEAHKIKDPSAQQTMAAKALGTQAAFRLAMTGTPLLNNPDDVWSIMEFVEPSEWGSRNQFRNRYCAMANAWHGGFENTGLRPETRGEFDAFFLPRFIRRTKAEVLPELPEKLPIDYRILPMDPKQRKAYEALATDMMAKVDGELLVAENPLDLLVRLRQAACALPVVDEDNQVTGLQAPSNKLAAIIDILTSAPGDPLVIYAESRKFIEMLHEHLSVEGKGKLTHPAYRCGLITGAQGAAIRAKAVEQFQSGQLDIILGTLGAGAEGLTLTRANRIVLAQQSWSHGVNAQAIDRIHRIGQTRGVQPIVLMSEGTVDLATAAADRAKEGRLQELVRDPAYFARLLRGETWA